MNFSLERLIPEYARKQITKLFTGQGFQYLTGFIYSIAGIRILGATGFGQLVLIQSIIALSADPFGCVDEGAVIKLLRTYIEDSRLTEAYSLTSTALITQWLLSLLYCLLLLPFLMVGAQFWELFQDWQTALMLFGMAEAIKMGRSYMNTFFSFNEFYGWYTCCLISKSFFRDIVIIPFMLWGVTITCFGFLIAELSICIVYLFLFISCYGLRRIKKGIISPDFKNQLRKLYMHIRSNYIASLLNTGFQQGQNLLLGDLVSPGSVSFFHVGKKLKKVLQLILGPIKGYLFPRLIEKWEDNREEFYYSLRKYIHFSLLFTISISIVLAIIAPLFYTFIYGDIFIRSAWVFWVLLPGIVISQVMSIFSSIVFVINQMRQLYIQTILQFVIGIISTVLLVPVMEEMGAALATSITMVTLGFYKAWIFRRHFGWKWLFPN